MFYFLKNVDQKTITTVNKTESSRKFLIASIFEPLSLGKAISVISSLNKYHIVIYEQELCDKRHEIVLKILIFICNESIFSFW